MAVVAERAFTSRSTLQRVEAGDTAVSVGIYAAVLQALGLLDGLAACRTELCMGEAMGRVARGRGVLSPFGRLGFG